MHFLPQHTRAEAKKSLSIWRTDFSSLFLRPERRPTRNTRLNVLGSAVHRPELAKKLATDQETANKVVGDPIRYAQAKGWIKDDFEPAMFAVWLNGSINSRRLIEMDGTHSLADEWDVLAKRAIGLVLGVPEPARKKPGATKKRR